MNIHKFQSQLPTKNSRSVFVFRIHILWKWFFYNWLLTLAVWPVRDCGRYPIKLHEKLKRATTLRIPLKPLLAIPRVIGCLFYFVNSNLPIPEFVFSFIINLISPRPHLSRILILQVKLPLLLITDVVLSISRILLYDSHSLPI